MCSNRVHFYLFDLLGHRGSRYLECVRSERGVDARGNRGRRQGAGVLPVRPFAVMHDVLRLPDGAYVAYSYSLTTL